MKKKIMWIAVSCLMVISLVMASCGPAAEEEVEIGEAEVVIEEEEEVEEEVVEEGILPPEVPKYGGVITLCLEGRPGTFDESAGMMHATAHTLKLTNQELMTGDWAKGPAGTGECDWASRVLGRIDGKAGCLAESWEMPELGHIIFHIRQGVHYALYHKSEASRLVNGRELTSNDVDVTLNTYITSPRCAISFGDTRKAIITAPDKWTVDVKIPVENFEDVVILGDFASIIPPEVWEKYGDMSDWRNSVGTGPFMLTDYVEGSSATFIRNPNYWEKDPVGQGKGNQLPYLDSVKYVIISDASTRLAALRTAKIDILHRVAWDFAESLRKTNPELKEKKYYTDVALAINMRVDKPELPFKDKRVRRALMMATDFETIKRDYFGGDAQILSWPIHYCKEYADAYLPLEEAPESVHELYVYNPDKARALLAEAGYPEGFKTTIVCSTIPRDVDYLSIIKDQWDKVGVELTLELLEPGAMSGIVFSRTHKEMILGGPGPISNLYNALFYTGRKFGGNLSEVDDPLAWETKDKMGKSALTDPAEADRVHKEFMKYVLDQAWTIPAPTPPHYHFWWPWVQNYYGVMSIGYDNIYGYAKYVWIDQDLKKSMGH